MPLINPKYRDRLHEIVYEADTPAGKFFDILLMALIILSILLVCLESVSSINAVIGKELHIIEWVMTILFTLEYLLRIWLVDRPTRYMRSFFGVVDLLSILPTYAGLFISGTQPFLILRSLRLLRVFRIFKLARYLGESNQLLLALRASRAKIIVFISIVVTLALIIGSLMYWLEGAEHGFTSIPRAFYWAIVTMTTVGYGDIAPQTVAGQTLATILMILGYGIIAVPTGIVTVEYSNMKSSVSTQACRVCSRDGHDVDAEYCKYCGAEL